MRGPAGSVETCAPSNPRHGFGSNRYSDAELVPPDVFGATVVARWWGLRRTH
jgi:hypothetical protein